MVDGGDKNGKKSDMSRGILLVVAGALLGSDGRLLMHKRPEGKHHAGLWEFPGGKVEQSETPVNALIRELAEELGIRVDARDCSPVGFAEEDQAISEKAIVILLYKIEDWAGEPQALEGGAVDWFEPDRISQLEKPPLDRILAKQLLRSR